jgi:cobalt transporter subunit CbtA
MSVFRTIVFSATVAGLIVGAAVTVAQLCGTIPLIQRSELYEHAVPKEATQPPITGAHKYAGHDHVIEWEPKDGLQRNTFTAAANILTAVGFSLLLAGIYAMKSQFQSVTWREGLLWGAGGFIVFTAAPGLGLPPDLPGMPVADLHVRQIWWIATATATASGLGLVVFRPSVSASILGCCLIVLPHLVGAPHPPEAHSDVPEALSHDFIVAVTLTNLLFWVLLGVLTSIAFRRISQQ